MALKRTSNRQPHQALALKKILRRCSSFVGESEDELIQDVPKGHFVVYVGQHRIRYIIPVTWLAHPEFKALLRQSEEEYGFKHEMGITIPCDEPFFLSVVSTLG
ncbi:protein SMALL AUXIN UP-REGULATED RNA 10-like [Spinacia oleracea]|uniref:Protein SMALL AUXIN UP-REGULATED RNA 10-like n=1 Tax=Spinacia oleracea TaxID=3562 RepID=A0A9R0JXF3_SPIOL|nr:protein SMALL AUXIN UP-REGULATED RNA 10-like [Spinacia oleracea]